MLLLDVQEDFLARPGLVSVRRADSASGSGACSRAAGRGGCPSCTSAPRSGPTDRTACRTGSERAPGPASRARPARCLRRGFARPQASRSFASSSSAPSARRGSTRDCASWIRARCSSPALYLHACVRATALDAYERGYDVWIVDDAVGSTEPVHAEITRSYLGERAARFVETRELLALLTNGASEAETAVPSDVFPVACIGGKWRAASAASTHALPTAVGPARAHRRGSLRGAGGDRGGCGGRLAGALRVAAAQRRGARGLSPALRERASPSASRS